MSSCSTARRGARSRSPRSWWSTATTSSPPPTQLGKASVKGKIVGTAKGPKINGFTYKKKSNQRRRYGHRQHYTVVEITSITTS